MQKQVKDDLFRIFVERIPPSLIFKGRSLFTKHPKNQYKDVKLKIKIIGRAVKLETHDIFGNFMMEAKVFSQLDMEIQKAVLHSYNGTASNIFYLRSTDVEKIVSNKEHFLNTLKIPLRQLIESP